MTLSNKIKVLIVDDSAFARKVIREILQSDNEIEVVGYARDGIDALEKIVELKPDVITLDLIMPDLDGVGLLKTFTKETLPKIIIVSVSGAESELALEALSLGAIDIITKPTALPTDKLYGLSSELAAKVKTAFHSKPKIRNEETADTEAIGSAFQYNGEMKLMVLGTSTGGPQAITEIFKVLPENFPVPLVIALHIPAGYTMPLAERVSRNSRLKMVEISDGMELLAGMAYIAPGGLNVLIRKSGDKIFAIVTREPEDSLFHPSINILFESAAEELGAAVTAVVLTGMGDDGMTGAMAIRKASGKVLAEAASSCVVYGMPRAVVESGAADGVFDLKDMAAAMLKSVTSPSGF